MSDRSLFPIPGYTQERITPVIPLVYKTSKSTRDEEYFDHYILSFYVGLIQMLFFLIKHMIKIANWGQKPVKCRMIKHF